MRTMRNLVAVFMLSGMLLFPTQSAQACHGRRCSALRGRLLCRLLRLCQLWLWLRCRVWLQPELRLHISE